MNLLRISMFKIFLIIMVAGILIPVISIIMQEGTINYNGYNLDRGRVIACMHGNMSDEEHERVWQEMILDDFFKNEGLTVPNEIIMDKIKREFGSKKDILAYCKANGVNFHQLSELVKYKLMKEDYFYLVRNIVKCNEKEINDLLNFLTTQYTGYYISIEKDAIENDIFNSKSENLAAQYKEYLQLEIQNQGINYFKNQKYNRFENISFCNLRSSKPTKYTDNALFHWVTNRTCAEYNEANIPQNIANAIIKNTSPEDIIVLSDQDVLHIIYIETLDSNLKNEQLKNEIEEIVYNFIVFKIQKSIIACMINSQMNNQF